MARAWEFRQGPEPPPDGTGHESIGARYTSAHEDQKTFARWPLASDINRYVHAWLNARISPPSFRYKINMILPLAS